MKLLLLAIGKRHDAELAKAIETYCKRLGHYATISWQLIDPARGKTDQNEVRRIETKALMAELRPEDYVIVLDERGQELRSTALAELLRQRQQNASTRIVCIIGGAYGVEDSLRQRANTTWSLSQLTFPHQLVRLILAEQLYRAFTIIRGEPYHHE